MPKVSIITPLYNGGVHIEACIRSVQAQSFQDYEHLIIDNMSSDDGVAKVRDLMRADDRIRLLDCSHSQGAAVTRNVGIDHAQGRYIAFLDCDDRWKPEKLSIQISAMEEASAAFSWTGYDIVGDFGEKLRVQTGEPGDRSDLITKRIVIGCLTAVYDRELLGLMRMTYTKAPEDFCLWVDILAKMETEGLAALAIPDSIAIYRVHSDGASADKKKAALAHWRALREHVGLTRQQAAGAFASYAIHTIWPRLKARLLSSGQSS